MKSILDKTFVYVKSSDTDIRTLFARIRAELEQAKQPKRPSNVQPLQRRAIDAETEARR